MENQHRKIKGYRELNQEEIDLMNEIKEKGYELGALIAKIRELPIAQTDEEFPQTISNAEIDLKTGIMWLVRSVALPKGF